MGEIRLELVMQELELPMEACYALSQARSIKEQRVCLSELKAQVLTQKKALIQKYRPVPGVYVIGENKVGRITQMADLVLGLRLPAGPTPTINPQMHLKKHPFVKREVRIG